MLLQVNNGHWLAANNVANYAQHRGFKCPVSYIYIPRELYMDAP